MEPILQFDPASLSIWYRRPPAEEPADKSLNQVATAALLGNHAQALKTAHAVDGSARQVRAAHMLSAVCHEQRHFADMLLTNFGQSMFRQFTSLLVNLPSALRVAAAEGRLGLPITVYGDAVKRRLLGIGPTDDLASVARDVRSRARLMGPDAAEHVIPGGTLSVGGRAQLEALGFFTQATFLQHEFSQEMAQDVQKDMPDRRHMRNQYAWAGILGAALGLTQDGEQSEDTLLALGLTQDGEQSEDTLVVLTPPVSALLYGALMVRRWGQEQSFVEGGDSGNAAARLGPLIIRLRSTGALKRATSTREAWQAVDEACADVFGRSAREELQQDLEHEARYCDDVAATLGADSAISRFLRGVHTARLRLRALFDASPEVLIDPNRYATLLGTILPVPIFVEAAGDDDDVPGGWATLWTGASELGTFGRVKWLWAKAPSSLFAASEDINVVGDAEGWKDVVVTWMPVVKLLLRGYRQPSILGPELMHGEDVLKGMGIDLRCDPLFAMPRVDTSSDAFWYLTGRDSANCDGCYSHLPRGSGHYLPGAALRRTSGVAAWLVGRYGGGEYGLFQARRDWTGWLLCDTCLAEFTAVLGLGTSLS